jgi:NAD(P)H-flavin reductase
MTLLFDETRRLPSPMLPTVVAVRDFRRETHDTFTVTLDAPNEFPAALPGQFNMLYGFGLGEVPISLSGDPAKPTSLVHTIRAVGSVTRGLAKLRIGDSIGVRGPFGTCWPLAAARGRDVVVIAGGIGLAPMRPALYHLARHRQDFGRVTVLYGARTPKDVLFRQQLQGWRDRDDFRVLCTVDQGDPSWDESVGLVTALLHQARFDPMTAVAMMCGPEIMMKFCLRALFARGLSEEQAYVTLERNMQCAIGMCGHCQFGPNFVCMDGAVFRYDRIKTFFETPEA